MAQAMVNRKGLVLTGALTAALLASLSIPAGPALAQAAPAPAATPGASQGALLSTDDFIQAVATLSTFSQRAGKLAQVLGQNNDLRRYARDLADDQKALQTLNAGLAEAKIEPVSIITLPANQSDLLQTLHRSGDREFDRMFMDLQVQTQQEALAIVQAYAESGDNPALKATAVKLTSLFQQKLAQARSMAKSVG